MSYAILQLNAPADWPLVEGWYVSADEAVEVATRLNAAARDGRIFRAVESQTNGIWRSLTGEPLYPRVSEDLRDDRGEYVFDPDDVALDDYVVLTTVIHGTVCPQIHG